MTILLGVCWIICFVLFLFVFFLFIHEQTKIETSYFSFKEVHFCCCVKINLSAGNFNWQTRCLGNSTAPLLSCLSFILCFALDLTVSALVDFDHHHDQDLDLYLVEITLREDQFKDTQDLCLFTDINIRNGHLDRGTSRTRNAISPWLPVFQ